MGLPPRSDQEDPQFEDWIRMYEEKVGEENERILASIEEKKEKLGVVEKEIEEMQKKIATLPEQEEKLEVL